MQLPVMALAALAIMPAVALAGGVREPEFGALPVLQHPSLIVDETELAELKRKLADPTAAEILRVIQTTVDASMDPASGTFIDFQDMSRPMWQARSGLYAAATVADMALLHRLTGQEKYAQFAKGMVLAIIRTKAGTRPPSKAAAPSAYGGWLGRPDHDLGWYAYSLAIFYDLCHDALSPEERGEFIEYAQDMLATYVRFSAEAGRMSLNNRGGRCAIGMAMLALAIRGQETRPTIHEHWRLADVLQQAVYNASAYAAFAWDIDGAPFEGASYAQRSIAMLAGLGRALARRGYRDFGRCPNPRLFPEYVLYTLCPADWSYIPIGDCTAPLRPESLLVTGARARDPVAQWLWRQATGMNGVVVDSIASLVFLDPTMETCSPQEAGLPLAKHFRGRGLVCALSGWSAADAKATFFCGPQQFGAHRQDDQNSFTFYAQGEKFAWDGGYLDFNLKERRYRRTDVHNAILIDGQGQNGYDNQHWPQGAMAAFRHTPGWTYALGDASRCYGLDGSITRADRHFFFKRTPTPYLLIVDDLIVDDRPHRFTWNFVTFPGNTITADSTGSHEVRGKKSAMRLLLRSPSRLEAVQDLAGDLPRLQVWQQATRGQFAALLAPTSGQMQKVDLVAGFHADQAKVQVHINGAVDVVDFDLRMKPRRMTGDETIEVRFETRQATQ